jgi:glutathione S-transferase
VPKEPAEQARMRLWSKFVDEGLFDGATELSFSAMFRERMRNMTEEQRQSRFHNVGDPERGARMKSWYELGVESPFVLNGIAAYEKAFKTMEADLAVGGPWLMGEDFTLADVNMMPFVARLEYLELLDVWTSERPRVQAWWARAKAWPSYITAIPDVLTDQEVAEMRNAGAKIRHRVAERRAEYLADLRPPALSGAA